MLDLSLIDELYEGFAAGVGLVRTLTGDLACSVRGMHRYHKFRVSAFKFSRDLLRLFPRTLLGRKHDEDLLIRIITLGERPDG